MLRLLKSKIKLFLKNGIGWSGDYANWQQAQQQCSGYDALNIPEKVKEAILKVKNGEAVYERDAVLFYEVAYSYPLLSVMLWVALKNNGKLSVLDFGGSLGSTYFQHKKILNDIKEVHWQVAEQATFVEMGRKFVQDNTISFHYTLDEAIANQAADLLLVSCALQYMEKPYELIEELMRFNIRYILIDNTPYNFDDRDRLTVQKVPPAIYTASYPCWFLHYEKVKNAFSKKYSLLSEHMNEDSIELDGRKITYQGFLLELKNN